MVVSKMKPYQFLCWDENRDQESGKIVSIGTFFGRVPTWASEDAAQKAAEHFNNEDVNWPLEQNIFVKGTDGEIEKFIVYLEQVPYYSAAKCKD